MSSTAAQTWVPYCGAAPVPAEWLGRWNFDPLLLAGLAAVAIGWQLLVGRSEPDRRKWLFASIALLVLVFVSPLCALASALFSARVVHHVLLTAAAAPLLVLSLPREHLLFGRQLLFWTVLSAVLFWGWHSPALYALALSSSPIYWLMQLTLLGSATGFWAALRRSGEPAAIAALLAATVQMGLLGALITFSGSPLYVPHLASTQPWGLEPLEDQQLAGLLMWIPGGLYHLAAALWFLMRGLKTSESGHAVGTR